MGTFCLYNCDFEILARTLLQLSLQGNFFFQVMNYQGLQNKQLHLCEFFLQWDVSSNQNQNITEFWINQVLWLRNSSDVKHVDYVALDRFPFNKFY
jgi:hypothetical protein